MELKNPLDNYNKVISYIDSFRLTDAILMLTELFRNLGKNNTLSSLKGLNETYSYLKRYAINGSADPTRNAQLKNISSELYRLADSYIRTSDAKNSSKEYFSVLRFEASRKEDSVNGMCDKLLEADSPEEAIAVAERLFKRIWISYPLHQEVRTAILSLFFSDTVEDYIKEFLLSSVLLGLIHYYDARRFNLLPEIYLYSVKENKTGLSAKAATAIVLVLLKYGRRARFDSATESLFERCSELPVWKSDLSAAYLCVVHTLDTPRINKKILDELVSGIMKLKPDIQKKLNNYENIRDFEDLEENPEWNEILEKSGLTDQMKQMAEIQMEGGDVFMSTFAHLKSFPFFFSMTNWFIPFTIHHPALSGLKSDNNIQSLLSSISGKVRFLCNSDKYSLALSLDRMPETQRAMISSQIALASDAQAEESSSELLPEQIERENHIKGYIQDLYRFFNLYSRKSEYINPFELPLDLTSSPFLSSVFAPDSPTVSAAAEFCFAHKHYILALKLFEYMSEGGVLSESLFQKIGYCYQALNNPDAALNAYRKAELLNGENLWTIKKIASLLAQSGNHDDALPFFKKYFNSNQENPSAIRSYLLAAISVKDAVLAKELLGRLDYYAPSPKNLRLSSMIRQIEGDYSGAADLMERFISEMPGSAKPDDYINNAILAVYAGKYTEALDSLSVARESELYAEKPLDEFYDKILDSAEVIRQRMDPSVRFDYGILNLLLDSLPRI